jgi:hypothetical protein
VTERDISQQDGWNLAGLCSEVTCGRSRLIRGLCQAHYKRWLATGEGQALPSWRDFTAAEWFWRSVDKSGGPSACWPFMGYRMAATRTATR